ncbi:MAG: Crp/Fnr family transcriptional regulator [bacterium]
MEQEKITVFPAGKILFKQGDFSRDLFFVKSGKVQLFRTEMSRTVIIATVESGGIIGEISALAGGQRSATAKVAEFSEMVVVTPAEFKTKIEELPDWLLKIAKIIAGRLRETDAKIEMESPDINYANILRLFVYFFSDKENQLLKKNEIENDINKFLSITFEEITDSINRIEKQGLIQIKANKIGVSSIKLLEEAADKARIEIKENNLF